MQLKPVKPFEPLSAPPLPSGDRWVTQIKWDGVRMLTYYDGVQTRLVNRRLHDRTAQYPELGDPTAYCSGSSYILDGEIIALANNRPSFHEVMKRESLRKSSSIQLAIQQVPVTYMIFDVLFHNGAWVVDQPLEERQRLLNSIIKPLPYVQVVANAVDGDQLYEVMKLHQMEGIIYKDLDSKYTLGGKDGRWRKRKIFHDLYAVVGGVTLRNGTVNALLLGLYQEGQLYYIGHAGTGKLTVTDWRQLTEITRPMRIADKPFVNEPERSKEALWIRPELTVKVQFMEWTPGRTMRHPSIQALAPVPLETCTFAQL